LVDQKEGHPVVQILLSSLALCLGLAGESEAPHLKT
jgi:hypothetical protein